MKKIGEYTCRGTMTVTGDAQIERIILNDGRFDTGYVIKSFQIAPHVLDTTVSINFSAKLITDDDVLTGSNWNWDSNSEIAWAQYRFDGNDVRSTDASFSTVDPDNLVIQDLYVVGVDASSGTRKMNYMITMEKYDITESQGALAMVRNRSQA